MVVFKHSSRYLTHICRIYLSEALIFFFFVLFVAGSSLNPLFDNAEFKSSYVQRAFQYLRLHEAGGQALDHFWFVPGQVMGDHTECIDILTR